MRTVPNPADPVQAHSGRFIDIFHSKHILDALNGKRDFGREQHAMPGALHAPEEDYRAATDVFVTELRKLVDAWLDSGRRADGVETRKDRKVRATMPNLGTDYMGEQTVFDSVQRWLIDNPPLVFLTESGEVQMSLRQSFKWWAQKAYRVDEPITAAFDEARTLFLLLMASKAKYALFKCSHPGCGVYYILKKPRGEYKLGPVCPEHRRQQGMRRRRQQDHAEALKVATEALTAWPTLSKSTHSKYKSEKDYIASKLKRFGVGSKWVTRNITEIRKREVSTHA